MAQSALANHPPSRYHEPVMPSFNHSVCRSSLWRALLPLFFTLPASAASPTLFAAKNNGPPMFLLFAILVVVALVGGGISLHLDKKRRIALQQTASQLGFDFRPDASAASVLSGVGGLDLFSLGRSPQVGNLIEGTAEGVHISLFDYQYTTGSGKNRSTHRQTVLLFRVEDAVLPPFSLRPENLFHKLGSALGYQDIDFGSNPKFSASYLLRGPEEPAIRQLFTPAALEFFENQPQCCVEAIGRYLILFRHHHLVKPENIPPFLETGLDVLSAFGLAHLALGEDGKVTVAG
jgi:hypothetical protein